MQEALVTFATELKSGDAQPTQGRALRRHHGRRRGDVPQGPERHAASARPRVHGQGRRLGRLLARRGQVHGPAGLEGQSRSLARAAWSPAYLRDGDWNIALKWLGDNGLCNNPDETTYDPDCLNWVAASDYIDAAEKYVAGYCEDRPVVAERQDDRRDARTSASTASSPGRRRRDRGPEEGRPGLDRLDQGVPLADAQRDHRHRQVDEGQPRRPSRACSRRIFEGGDQVKTSTRRPAPRGRDQRRGLQREGRRRPTGRSTSTACTEKDKQGLTVELGGSSVNNLADNLLLFGLAPGSANLFAATYTVFGDIVVAQYPDLVPELLPGRARSSTPPTSRRSPQRAGAHDRSRGDADASPPAQPVQDGGQPQGLAHQVRHRQADVHAAAPRRELEQLLRDLLVASGTAVEVHGHTDNAGDADANMKLSEERAFAVKKWLEQQSPVNFPEGRVRVFAHGQQNPVAPNSTTEGRGAEPPRRDRDRDHEPSRLMTAARRRTLERELLRSAFLAQPRRSRADDDADPDRGAGRDRRSLFWWSLAVRGAARGPARVFRALGRPLDGSRGWGRSCCDQLHAQPARRSSSRSSISLALSYLTVLPVFRPLVAAVSQGPLPRAHRAQFRLHAVRRRRPPAQGLAARVRHDRLLRHLHGRRGRRDPAGAVRPRAHAAHERVARGVGGGRARHRRPGARGPAPERRHRLDDAHHGRGHLALGGRRRRDAANQNKHFHLAEVFAIQLVILVVGVLQDYGIGVAEAAPLPLRRAARWSAADDDASSYEYRGRILKVEERLAHARRQPDPARRQPARSTTSYRPGLVTGQVVGLLGPRASARRACSASSPASTRPTPGRSLIGEHGVPVRARDGRRGGPELSAVRAPHRARQPGGRRRGQAGLDRQAGREKAMRAT